MPENKATVYRCETGRHMHCCHECGTWWEHSDDVAGLRGKAKKLTHKCPECGVGAYIRYYVNVTGKPAFQDHHMNPPKKAIHPDAETPLEPTPLPSLEPSLRLINELLGRSRAIDADGAEIIKRAFYCGAATVLSDLSEGVPEELISAEIDKFLTEAEAKRKPRK